MFSKAVRCFHYCIYNLALYFWLRIMVVTAERPEVSFPCECENTLSVGSLSLLQVGGFTTKETCTSWGAVVTPF